MSPAQRRFPLIFAAAGGLLVLFILLPLAITLFSVPPADPSGTLSDPEVLASLAVTFLAASLATLIGLLGGVPLAYLLARVPFRGRALVSGLIDLPVIIPHTAAGIALLMVFGRQGLLGQAFGLVGLFFTDTLTGIVVAMLFVGLPYLVNGSQTAFALLDPEMERVALIDGASHWQAFWLVALPQAWRGILSGSLMMWARGISEFGAVVILAYHPRIIPVLIYERFQGFGLNAALAPSALLILVALFIFVLVRALLQPVKERP